MPILRVVQIRTSSDNVDVNMSHQVWICMNRPSLAEGVRSPRARQPSMVLGGLVLSQKAAQHSGGKTCGKENKRF